jgi:hypothetical protein
MKSSFPDSLRWLALATALLPANLGAYPEYHAFVVKHSGRPINCAMCHRHADGPDGAAPGQLGRLTPEAQERLGRARSAFEPGVKVDSPILNAFGNHMVQALGRKQLMELKMAPEQLAERLPSGSDLDGDGIPDVREFLDGTHPLNRNDGHPWLLFRHNLMRNLPQIALTLAATAAGLWGLSHLLRGFAAATQIKDEEEESESA